MAATSSNAVQLLIGGKVQPGLFAGLDRLSGELTGLNGLLQGLTKTLIGLNLAQRLAGWSTNAIAAADAIGKLAEKTGIGVEALAQLSHAAKQNDVEIASLQRALKELSEWMARNGQAGRSVDEVLLELADSFASMPDGAEKAALAIERFGESGLDLIPFLNQGCPEVVLRRRWQAGSEMRVAFPRDRSACFRDSSKAQPIPIGEWGAGISTGLNACSASL